MILQVRICVNFYVYCCIIRGSSSRRSRLVHVVGGDTRSYTSWYKYIYLVNYLVVVLISARKKGNNFASRFVKPLHHTKTTTRTGKTSARK